MCNFTKVHSNKMEYINSLLSCENVLQFMMFADDSVEIQFKDHTSLQISPCGANYQFSKSVDGCPGLIDHHNVIRQRCRFATSNTKQKVDLGLKLRNLFATRPYIPMQFIHLSDESKVRLHRDITSFYWVDDDGCTKLEHADDNSVNVKSQHEVANVQLYSNGLQAQASFLARISPCTSRTTTPAQSPREKKSSAEGAQQEGRREYIWLKHIFPVQLCPKSWQYPLSKALSISGKQLIPNLEGALDVTHAPRPLPSVCAKQFRHQWRADESLANSAESELVLPTENERSMQKNVLKLLWNNKTLYWLNCTKSSGDMGIEVWMHDGSVLKSISASKYYLRHLSFNAANGAVELERTYSPTALPLKPDLKTVILRAVRLLSYIEQNGKIEDPSSNSICWHDALSLESKMSLNSLEDDKIQPNLEVVVPNLGKFTAINGSIQVSFDDESAMHVAVSQSQYLQLKKSSEVLAEIPWRLRMSDGTYKMNMNLLHCDADVSAYIKPTCDWILWLGKSSEERMADPFYSDSFYSADKLSMVSKELKKINMFNSKDSMNSLHSICNESSFGLNNSVHQFQPDIPTYFSTTVIPSKVSVESGLCMTPADIARALSNTSKAICDIDDVLNACR
uniref:Uncharacterized protein C5orf34 homolog n=1 Tax=Phallusia mammillata TaxID=59560 RepID=A0A6F9D8V7_9ASCI|nr:uncharacterized protein C5orf34 homolog [Phallusia mammillata]